MNKRKRIGWIVFSILLLLLISEIVLLARLEGQKAIQSETNVPTENLETQEQSTDTHETTLPGSAEGADGSEPSCETAGTQPNTQETLPNTETEGIDTLPGISNNSIELPYAIPGSSLIIERINPYDGLFLEDGSDQEVSNIMAMVLRNTGDTCIEYANIIVECEGTKLQFTASSLAPGSAAIVLEANRKQFSEGTYTKCSAEISEVEELEMSQDKVQVEDNPEGGIRITNISQEEIPCIRIFYKFYMSDMDAYVGGITYTAKVVDLKAGQSCVVKPSHYLQGYSKIVMVKTYDTDA